MVVVGQYTGSKSGTDPANQPMGMVRLPITVTSIDVESTMFVAYVRLDFASVMARMPWADIFAADNDIGKFLRYEDTLDMMWLDPETIIGHDTPYGSIAGQLQTNRQKTSFGVVATRQCIHCPRTHPANFTGCFTDTDDTFVLNQKIIDGLCWMGCIYTANRELVIPCVGVNLLKLDMSRREMSATTKCLAEYVQTVAYKSDDFLNRLRKDGGMDGISMNPYNVSYATNGIPPLNMSEAILFESQGMGKGEINPQERAEYYETKSTLDKDLTELGVTTEVVTHPHGLDENGRLSRTFVARFLVRGMAKERSRAGRIKRLAKGRISYYQRQLALVKDLLDLLRGNRREQLVAHCKHQPYVHGTRDCDKLTVGEVDDWSRDMTRYIQTHITKGMNLINAQEIMRYGSPALSPELSLPENITPLVEGQQAGMPEFSEGVHGKGVVEWLLSVQRNPVLFIEPRHSWVETLERLRKYLFRDVKTVNGESYPVTVPDLSINMLATAIWVNGQIAVGWLETFGGEFDPDEDYNEEAVYQCWIEQHDRSQRRDHFQGRQPKRIDTDAKTVAHFRHEDAFFKMILLIILMGEPYEGNELTDENVEKWRKAINANNVEEIGDLPRRIFVNTVCFLELQAKDRHADRHNLQALYLVDKAKASGPENEIAQAAIEAASRSSAGQKSGKKIQTKRIGLKGMVDRAQLVATVGATAFGVRVAHAFSAEVAKPVYYSTDYYSGYSHGFKSVRIPTAPIEPDTDLWSVLLTTMLIGLLGLVLMYNRKALPSAVLVVQRCYISVMQKFGYRLAEEEDSDEVVEEPIVFRALLLEHCEICAIPRTEVDGGLYLNEPDDGGWKCEACIGTNVVAADAPTHASPPKIEEQTAALSPHVWELQNDPDFHWNEKEGAYRAYNDYPQNPGVVVGPKLRMCEICHKLTPTTEPWCTLCKGYVSEFANTLQRDGQFFDPKHYEIVFASLPHWMRDNIRLEAMKLADGNQMVCCVLCQFMHNPPLIDGYCCGCSDTINKRAKIFGVTAARHISEVGNSIKTMLRSTYTASNCAGI